MTESGHLGLIMAISDEMQAEGWEERSDWERLEELRRRLLVALGRICQTDGGDVVTTASGQIVMPLGSAG